MWRRRKIAVMLVMALAIKLACVMGAYELPFSVLESLGVPNQGHAALIDYAPEVWLSLLALVFGTLIIVVSIASESTPRLVDMFVGDPVGRLYIWLIMLSTLENILLQLIADEPTVFFSNMIFVNNYLALPASVLLAIPYTFYILKFTKNTNVIEFIFRENVKAIRRARSQDPYSAERNQRVLFETVNQLHDLLQYTQFKEPKSDVITRLGKSAKYYLKLKGSFPDRFFGLSAVVKDDISFRSLREKFEQIEHEKTFYEQKVLRILNAIYLILIKEGHFELASLCASELVEIGNTAVHQNDAAVTNAVILNLNTVFRYSINHALRTREIRNAYNVIFYYNEFIQTFVARCDHEKVELCCHYFELYAVELTKLQTSEPQFSLLIDAMAWELKKNLIRLFDSAFPSEVQMSVLHNVCNLSQLDVESSKSDYPSRGGLGLIKVSLCLFYVSKAQYAFVDMLLDSLVRDFKFRNAVTLLSRLAEDCRSLRSESEAFWEETDQGNRNIYFSDGMEHIPRLLEYAKSWCHRYEFVN